MKTLSLTLPTAQVVQVLKRYLVAIFILLIVLASNAQEGGDSINGKKFDEITADDVLADSANAEQNWDKIPPQKREEMYKDSKVLKQFSQQFANEKQISKLDLKEGAPQYDGTYLKNGDGSTKINVLQLKGKGAEVASLSNGGFSVKFPEGSNLADLDFTGGTNGILFDGENLIFKDSKLSNGKITIYNPNHIKIWENSVFETNNLRFTTQAQEFDLYNAPTNAKNNFIRLDEFISKIRIVGNDITAEFLEGNKFNGLSVNGRMKVVNGGVELEFDGKGNSYEKIPLGEPLTKIEIEDENAPEKKYMLNPKDESKLDKANLEVNVCPISGITGGLITDVSGRVSQSICKGPLVKTGISSKSGYETSLELNKEQVKEIKNEFTKKFGHEPNLDSDEDIKRLSEMVDKVTELRFTQKFFQGNPLPRWMVDSAIRGWLATGLNSESLTPIENEQVNVIVDIVTYKIKNGDTLTFELSGNKGRVVYTTKDGLENVIPVSYRLPKAYARRYYNGNINVPQQSRELFNTYFGIKELASK